MLELQTEQQILAGLNRRQRQAVQITEGPLWVTAGAGSGKTRVLIRRLAYLIAIKHVAPQSLVAITFTKKAAGEMQERLVKLIGSSAYQLQISTIHSLAARLLREHAFSVGLTPNFQVGDETYQKQVVQHILRDLHLGQGRELRRATKDFKLSISQAKIRNLDPDQVYAKAIDPQGDQNVGSSLALESPSRFKQVYQAYQQQLKNDQRVDFDDLLMLAVKLLNEHPLVLKLYQKQWHYFSVDEYQDTNLIQYELIRLLASQERNLCVVGDLDQSIYGFQGADHRNIAKFKQDFAPIQQVVLDQNYRSTNTILKIANAVIGQEPDRENKTLWSNLGDGEPADVYYLDDADTQAERTVQLIQEQLDQGVDPGEIVILYRMNSTSRSFEQSLLNHRIPYQIVKGLSFYKRTEIRVTLAYLTLLLNPDDWVSWTTVINLPRRGFGDKAFAKLHTLWQQAGSMAAVLANLDHERGGLTTKQVQALQQLGQQLGQLRAVLKQTLTLDSLVPAVMTAMGYRNYRPWQDREKWQMVVDNLGELQTAINQSSQDYRRRHLSESSTGAVLLQNFINNWAIAWQDPDDEADLTQGKISLMTMHAAKGLEFTTVFIVDAVVGEMPMQMDDSDPNEERRLAYVAITRAKRRLFFMVPMHRMLWGQEQECEPSWYLDDFPKELANWHHEDNVNQDDSWF